MNALRRRISRLGPLLALSLLLGQWLAIVHATQHELSAPASQATCEICIVAHGAGALPSPTATPVAVHASSQLLIAALPAPRLRQVLARPRARAPPFLI